MPPVPSRPLLASLRVEARRLGCENQQQSSGLLPPHLLPFPTPPDAATPSQPSPRTLAATQGTPPPPTSPAPLTYPHSHPLLRACCAYHMLKALDDSLPGHVLAPLISPFITITTRARAYSPNTCSNKIGGGGSLIYYREKNRNAGVRRENLEVKRFHL